CSHRRAALRITIECHGRVANVGPSERRLERARHFEADRGDDDAIDGSSRCLHRDRESVRGRHALADANDANVEAWHRELGHLDQFICCLKYVEDGGQPEVERAVESKNVHSHGKYDTKNGILANSPACGTCLFSCSFVQPYRRYRCCRSAYSFG